MGRVDTFRAIRITNLHMEFGFIRSRSFRLVIDSRILANARIYVVGGEGVNN